MTISLTEEELRATKADYDAAAAQQSAEPVDKAKAFDEFVEYVKRNYSGEVVFSNPQWHAERLWRAAHRKYAAPPAVQPLTAQQLDALIERHCGGTEIDDGQYSAMVIFAASVERAHGIGTDRAAPPAALRRKGPLPPGHVCPSCGTPAVQAEPVSDSQMAAIDSVIYGGYVTLDGKRIDPTSVYAAPPADDEAVRLLRDILLDLDAGANPRPRIDAYLAKVTPNVTPNPPAPRKQ